MIVKCTFVSLFQVHIFVLFFSVFLCQNLPLFFISIAPVHECALVFFYHNQNLSSRRFLPVVGKSFVTFCLLNSAQNAFLTNLIIYLYLLPVCLHLQHIFGLIHFSELLPLWKCFLILTYCLSTKTIGLFQSFVRSYESTLNCIISVNTYST